MNKLFYTFYIIKEAGKPISAQDIKDDLAENYDIHIDIKTVYQAIKNINELFELFTGKTCIKTTRRKGYSIEEDFFDDGQLQYLLDSVASNRDINADESEELLELLKSLSSKSQLSRLYFNKPNSRELNFDLLLNMTTVIKAINDEKNIYFKYVSYEIKDNKLAEVYHKNGNDKNPEYYIISPYRLIQRDSKYYVLGYFSTRKDRLSLYRLDRMRMVRQHKSPFIDIKDQFEMEKETENINMYVSGEKETLEICFDESIVREVVYQFGQDCHVKKTFDNRFILEVDDVLISEGLIGWILMLKEHIQVIRPISLKDKIKETLEKMNQLYQ